MSGAVTVRAARLVEHGKPVEVQEIQLPKPRVGEVLVELSYAGVNPVDRYNALGKVALDGPVPRTLGGEAAGHVDGKPVVVSGQGLGAARDGVFAEAVVVPEGMVIDVPDGVALRDAAAMGVAGLTAWQVVEMGEIGPGDRVLVLGGSGGVGLPAISYAVSKGADVWGQTSNASKAASIAAMGASKAVIAASGAALADAVRDFKPTAVLDSLGGQFTSSVLTVMAQRGRLVLFGASSGSTATIELLSLYRNRLRILTYGGLIATLDERRDGLAHALQALAEGKLRLSVGAELGLDSVNDALDLIADRSVTGKILLKLR
jgi:NADPH:quinone reductase